jgi:hypothetical protein
LGLIFHAADGVPRLVRNDMYRQRSATDWHDALDWVFSAPDYVRNFANRNPRPVMKKGVKPPRAARARSPQ